MACKILHIGVFFDGTGNNKVNDIPSSGQSNIAKLSELYRHNEIWTDPQKREHKSIMIYKNGVGTTDGERHIVQDKFDKGGGGGGAKRINEAIDEVVKLLKAHPVGSNNSYVDRIIDVWNDPHFVDDLVIRQHLMVS